MSAGEDNAPRVNPVNRLAGGILDHPWFVVLALGAVALTMWIISTRTQSHYVKASFSSAFNLYPGLDVQIDGEDVGKMGRIEYQQDGTATVELGIDKEEHWPLHQGTRAIMRYGTTIGNGTRKIDVTPGPSGNPELPEDGIISAKFTKPVVDVDEVVNIFTKKRRTQVQPLMKELDEGLEGQAINGAIEESAPGISAAGRFLSDLGADETALRGLVVNTRRAMGNLASRSETVQDLVTATAATFDELAENTDGMEHTLVAAPPAFRETRSTLARLDESLGGLTSLVNDLRPGARRLTPLAAAATPALRELRATVPSGVSAVRAVRTASPQLTKLFTAGRPFLTRTGADAEQLAPMVSCIRPYAPEAGSAINGLAGWTQGFEYDFNTPERDRALNHPLRYEVQPKAANGAALVHGLRALPILSARSAHVIPPEISTEAFAKLTGTNYAYPRPPGLTTGQPWFQPECGVGPESLDPAFDPED